MQVRAVVDNHDGAYDVAVETNGVPRTLSIAPKPQGQGSSVNGGELLFLALATCYCNDLHREAAKSGIRVTRVQVEVDGRFPTEGGAAADLTYRASVTAHAPERTIRELMEQTDRVAEIQHTVRAGTPIRFSVAQALSE